MSKAYVFDWGDTLMVDFPGVPGPMKGWDYVEAVDGAEAALKSLSSAVSVYVATGANAPARDVEAALSRVNLSQYIAGYFSPMNTGYTKTDPAFYKAIAASIGLETGEITMVGDSFVKDVAPPVSVGMNAIWLSSSSEPPMRSGVRKIQQLNELC